MFKRKKEIVMETPPVLMTGRVRAALSPYDFKYYLEHQYSDGSWAVNPNWPAFVSIKEAKEHFERAKRARREIPATLGDLDGE